MIKEGYYAMKRRIFAIIIASIMVISLAGCGGSTPNVKVDVKDEAETGSESVEASQEKGEADSDEERVTTPESYTVEEKTVPMYIASADNKQEIKLFFVNNGIVPYISVADISGILK